MAVLDLRHGDCRTVMAAMPADSVDAIVTDPPYGLSFMGKDWDHGIPGIQFWLEALRVAKPGAHLLAFGGTRTFHRLAVAIEDAGWEMRDTIMYVYGSGFPKSLDVSKAIDKATVGVKVVGEGRAGKSALGQSLGWNHTNDPHRFDITAPNSDAARQWEGWGTALKPAWEPIIVARKPLIGTVAENVLAHGTGAINVDGCRVEGMVPSVPQPKMGAARRTYGHGTGEGRNGEMSSAPAGRWPANVAHDGSEEVLAGFPQTTTGSGRVRKAGDADRPSGWRERGRTDAYWQGDSGSAARFFYCAKASKADRDEGCEGLPVVRVKMNNGNDAQGDPVSDRFTKMARNTHPTVKPTALMRYLVRLVTPPSGTVLDPFMGSGSTGKAAALEGCGFIGIELDAEYIEIARARIAHALQSNKQQTLQL